MAKPIIEVQMHGDYDDLVHMSDVVRTYHSNVDTRWSESLRLVSDGVKTSSLQFEEFAKIMQDIAPVGVRVEVLRSHGPWETRDFSTHPKEEEA